MSQRKRTSQMNMKSDTSVSGSGSRTRSENLKQQAVARRASGLVRDLIAVRAPEAARRDASMEVARLAQLIAAGRISITEARAQLRGAA